MRVLFRWKCELASSPHTKLLTLTLRYLFPITRVPALSKVAVEEGRGRSRGSGGFMTIGAWVGVQVGLGISVGAGIREGLRRLGKGQGLKGRGGLTQKGSNPQPLL